MEENKTTETVNVEELRKQIEELTSQNKNLKSTLSERNSEAAQRKREAEEWKNKFQSTLSDQEKAEAKRKEETETMAAKLKALERTNAISEHKAKYLAMGYTEELAQSSAEAMVDGNSDVLYANMSTFITANTEKVKAEMLKEQPKVSSGQTPAVDENQQQLSEMMKYAF